MPMNRPYAGLPRNSICKRIPHVLNVVSGLLCGMHTVGFGSCESRITTCRMKATVDDREARAFSRSDDRTFARLWRR